ncbi:hypothetical protein [Paenibacillus prosopidis]|uniref:hypothetical protein n=1 Tax=Paenibacillus prosopidis TaxID=630520 RepID=UPI000DF364F9|nr:hypothetical protein [Paenibacillus prosopidis]
MVIIKRIVPSCLVAAVLMLMTTGRWGRREMSDISIVAGLGIGHGTNKKDKAASHQSRRIAVRKGTEGGSPTYLFQGEGVRCSRPSVEQQKVCEGFHHLFGDDGYYIRIFDCSIAAAYCKPIQSN